MKIKYIYCFISIIYSHCIFAQIIDNDQAKSDVKWEQINRQNHRLIFPVEFRNKASILSYQLEKMHEQSSQDLGVSPRKISIILHANHIEQNGFVQLAPRKSEFFPIPSGVASNVEWLPNLALHELRHVAQIDKLTGNLRKPFFEQLAFAFYGIHLPAWYFEGDAVSIETQFSKGGRGRIPSWFMPIRTNELADRHYSLDKNILGSFKDITPSFYTTGYLMNTHLTNMHGYDVKEKVMNDMKGKLLRPFNFYKALHKYTSGLNSRRLYQGAIDSFRNIWMSEAKEKTEYTKISTPDKKYPSSYLLPQYLGDTLIALVQSPQKINQIARIDRGKVYPLVYPGAQLMPHFHANGALIIWDELRKDARFGKNTFNAIHIYDITTGRIRSLAVEDWLYTPTLHPGNSEFAAVKVAKDGLTSLVIHDLSSNTRTKEIELPEGLHIQQPHYNATGDKIVCIAVNRSGTSLLEFDLSNSSYSVLLPWGNQVLERPTYHGNQILFKAHYNGIDNIYALNRNDKTIHEITDTRFGAFNPSIKGDSLIFNDYAYDGYKIAQVPITNGKLIDLEATNELAYDRHLSNGAPSIQQIDTPIVADIRPYHPLADFFSFHSLSISSNNFENFDNFKPGLFWLANDLLNTSQLKLGYEYDTDIRKSIYSAEVNYSRYYPKFSIRYQNRGQIGQAVQSDSTRVNFDWREHYTSAEIQLPFSIYRRQTIYSYGINFGTSYQKRYDVSLSNLKNFNEAISFPLNYQIYFNKNMRRSAMDLQPQWGQNISMTYRHVPFENALEGDIFSVRTNFYFPGFFSNHGLQVRMSYQKKDGRYLYTNDIPLVNGFGHFVSAPLDNTLLFAYRLPLAYPDWTIGPLAYVKRIQAQLAADYQNIQNSTLAPKTFGLGISADINVFRYVLPDVNIAARATYINDASASQRVVPTFSLSYTY